MTQQEVVTRFKVWYKPNPGYDGDWHNKMKPGLHGIFDSLEEAKEGAANCKRYFNEEKIKTQKALPSGKLELSVKTVHHDNVVVVMEKYVDGQLEGEVPWDESKAKQATAKK